MIIYLETTNQRLSKNIKKIVFLKIKFCVKFFNRGDPYIKNLKLKLFFIGLFNFYDFQVALVHDREVLLSINGVTTTQPRKTEKECN